jgi:hypothetical protein
LTTTSVSGQSAAVRMSLSFSAGSLTTALKEYAAYLNPIIDRGETPLIDASPWT